MFFLFKKVFQLPFWLTFLSLLFLPSFISNNFHYEVVIISLLNASVVLGLNLLLGYIGQISLAHGAFFVTSPYVTIILMLQLDWSFLPAILISLLLLFIFSLIIAIPIIHLKGHYFAMATLGIGLILYIILNNEVEITGGPDGLATPDLTLPFLSIEPIILSPLIWYYLVLFFFIGILIVVNLLHLSQWRIVLQSIRFNEKNMSRLGINTRVIKIAVFSFSVLVTGLAGNLYAFYAEFISPQDANFTFSVELLAMVIIGGIGHFYGGIAGSFLLTLLPQVLIYFADWKHFLLGIVIMVIIIFLPNGLGGLGNTLKSTFRLTIKKIKIKFK